MLFVRVIIAAATLTLLWACSKKSDETATGSEVQLERDGSGETVMLDSGAGQTTISTGKDVGIPKNYPKDGFIPRDARITMSATEGETVMVTFNVPGPVSDVFRRNHDALRGLGWGEVTAEQSDDGLAYATYRKEKWLLTAQFNTQMQQSIPRTSSALPLSCSPR